MQLIPPSFVSLLAWYIHLQRCQCSLLPRWRGSEILQQRAELGVGTFVQTVAIQAPVWNKLDLGNDIY
jgi:hypothetical protein